MAEQILTPESIEREARDAAFRRDLAPVRDLMRPHVFPDRQARDAACRQPMRGGVFAFRSTTADGLGEYLGSECLFAVGPRIADPEFATVASAIVDPEIDALFERCSAGDVDPEGESQVFRSAVLTVFGVHYQLCVDEDWDMQVRAKAPFEILPDDEVEATASWLWSRLSDRYAETRD